MPSTEAPPARRASQLRLRAVVLAFLAAAIAIGVALAIGPSPPRGGAGNAALDANPNLDPGTRLSGLAANFTLVDQFGRTVSLESFRGRVVLLAFIDARCTAVCPQATQTSLRVRQLLGSARTKVELLAVNTNPAATAVNWVAAYSRAHGALNAWQFLTGTRAELERVWRAYHVGVTIANGQVEQTPALYVIDQHDRLTEIYEIQPSYAGVAQQAQLVAEEVAHLLRGHAAVHAKLSYAETGAMGTATRTRLPRAGGGDLEIGPDGKPRLYVFVASWLSETMNLRSDLEALAGYVRLTAARHLPQLTVIDEASVEPDAAALPALLRTLRPALAYPVAIDRTGQVADGYLVQDQPWFVLADAAGRELWYSDASVQGWPSTTSLVEEVRAALASPGEARPPTPKQERALLAGSPAPLASLHNEHDELLGSVKSLKARIRSLLGFPIVVNAWASWCQACKAEYPLFAQASARFGREVAFIGVDTLDFGASSARAFLHGHPVSYPSYQSPSGSLPGLGDVLGLPATIYINRRGRVVKTVSGQYDSLGALYGAIQQYAGL